MSIAPPGHTRRNNTTDSWITPEWLIERLGPFDLDPCASDPQPWPTAAMMLTEKDDGLTYIWNGFVWCNPPYGRRMGVWMERMAVHQNGIALVFARTETQAFARHVWPHASSLLFLEGRLNFFRPDGSPPKKGRNSGGPSVLVGYGEEAQRRLQGCRDLGAVVTPDRGLPSVSADGKG